MVESDTLNFAVVDVARFHKSQHTLHSLNTLRRYADACGMKLVIQMVAH